MENYKSQWVNIEGQHNLPDEDIIYKVELKNGDMKNLGFYHHNPSCIKYWLENVTKYYVE